jgi:hypothetical protein
VNEIHKSFAAEGGNVHITPGPDGSRALTITCTGDDGSRINLQIALDRAAASALAAALVDEPKADR